MSEPAAAPRKVPFRRPVRQLLVRLRTEGGSPGRQAGAVALGVFIGCSPFYGLHLALCVLFARLLGLNRMLTYLAAHVSLPGIWPLLVFAELQVGRRLRGAEALSIRPAEIRTLDLGQFTVDLLVGSAVVGTALAALLGLFTLWAARKRQRHPAQTALVEATALRYLDAGMFDWELVRGKLRHDPVYFEVLRRGLLPAEGLLLDLGCGRGIVPALLATARQLHAGGTWPAGWAPPPPALEVHGIEGRPRDAETARRALAGEAVTVATGDLTSAELPPARAALLLDVLHYLPAEAQETLLARLARALEPGGVLLVREADAAGGARFAATRAQERLAALARRHGRQRFHYRSAAEWRELLDRLGFAVETDAMAMGTPYSNVLVKGTRR